MQSFECRVCGSSDLVEIANFKDIPVAHRLTKVSQKDVLSHPMIVHSCKNCTFSQINKPIPPELLYKDYNYCFSSWKPNPHIQDEINTLKEMGVNSSHRVLEIGCNEGVFLEDLRLNGITKTLGIEPNPHATKLAASRKLETITDFFGPHIVDRLSEYGKFDAIVSRQVVEHIQDLKGLMNSVIKVSRLGTIVMFEVPDFDVPLENGDVTALWEEHVNYFNEKSLNLLMESFGFKVLKIKRYDFSGGAIVVFASYENIKKDSHTSIKNNFSLYENFSSRSQELVNKLITKLKANKSKGVKNYLYGSGCRANMFLNAYGLEELIDGIVDDQIDKQGLFMPNSKLRIQNSKSLNLHDVYLLFAVNSENEPKIIKRENLSNTSFVSVNSPSSFYYNV